MDPAVLQLLQSWLAALHKCMAEGADTYTRWMVSEDVLARFQEVLVPEIPGLQEAWEVARDIYCTAAMDIFGQHSALRHQLYPSPFASPVSAPVMLPPQPAEVATLQPAKVAKLQPDEVALPPHSADEFLHKPPAVAEVVLPPAEAKSQAKPHAKLQAKPHAK